MSLAVTAWRLTSTEGHPAECVVSELDEGWYVTVREGKQITFSERCESDEAALARASEIWKVLIEQGWTERRH